MPVARGQPAASTLLLTLFHMLLLALATCFSATTMTMTINATISPYSTAVAPRESRNAGRNRPDRRRRIERGIMIVLNNREGLRNG